MNTTNIDVSDYVEASEGASSLFFNNPKQQARFELGVSMCIYKWDALEVAVQNSWGGPQSAEKRDWITAIVVELFQDRVVEVQQIEDVMLNAMEDEFDVNVEDDSALPVAAMVMQVYKECSVESYGIVEAMYTQWQEKQAKREQEAAKYAVNVQNDPMNPDTDEDDDDDDDDETNGDDSAPQLIDSQDHPMTIDEEPKGPIIDEDGFQVVQKGRRNNRR